MGGIRTNSELYSATIDDTIKFKVYPYILPYRPIVSLLAEAEADWSIGKLESSNLEELMP